MCPFIGAATTAPAGGDWWVGDWGLRMLVVVHVIVLFSLYIYKLLQMQNRYTSFSAAQRSKSQRSARDFIWPARSCPLPSSSLRATRNHREGRRLSQRCSPGCATWCSR